MWVCGQAEPEVAVQRALMPSQAQGLVPRGDTGVQPPCLMRLDHSTPSSGSNRLLHNHVARLPPVSAPPSSLTSFQVSFWRTFADKFVTGKSQSLSPVECELTQAS